MNVGVRMDGKERALRVLVGTDINDMYYRSEMIKLFVFHQYVSILRFITETYTMLNEQ